LGYFFFQWHIKYKINQTFNIILTVKNKVPGKIYTTSLEFVKVLNVKLTSRDQVRHDVQIFSHKRNDGSGSKYFDPSWINSLLLGSGRVSHPWLMFGFRKFPLKIPNFPIFALPFKRIDLGWVKKYP